MRLLPSETLLFVIDVQKKLFSSMFEQKVTKQTICNIIDGAIILGVPIIYTEQYPTSIEYIKYNSISNTTVSLKGNVGYWMRLKYYENGMIVY